MANFNIIFCLLYRKFAAFCCGTQFFKKSNLKVLKIIIHSCWPPSLYINLFRLLLQNINITITCNEYTLNFYKNIDLPELTGEKVSLHNIWFGPHSPHINNSSSQVFVIRYEFYLQLKTGASGVLCINTPSNGLIITRSEGSRTGAVKFSINISFAFPDLF